MRGRPNPKVRMFEDAAYEKEKERKGYVRTQKK